MKVKNSQKITGFRDLTRPSVLLFTFDNRPQISHSTGQNISHAPISQRYAHDTYVYTYVRVVRFTCTRDDVIRQRANRTIENQVRVTFISNRSLREWIIPIFCGHLCARTRDTHTGHDDRRIHERRKGDKDTANLPLLSIVQLVFE